MSTHDVCQTCNDLKTHHHPVTHACWDVGARNYSQSHTYEPIAGVCQYCSEPLSGNWRRVYRGINMHEPCLVAWKTGLSRKTKQSVSITPSPRTSTQVIEASYLDGHIPSAMEVSLLWGIECGYITTDEAIRVALSYTLPGTATADGKTTIVVEPS